jgi:hypothetical protein
MDSIKTTNHPAIAQDKRFPVETDGFQHMARNGRFPAGKGRFPAKTWKRQFYLETMDKQVPNEVPHKQSL